MLKYELIHSDKPLLYRIKALKDFSDVKKGDLGGYVSNNTNLDQNGDAWVYDDAEVHGTAVVFEDAKIRNNAVIKSESYIFGNTEVKDNACVDSSRLYGDTILSDSCKVLSSMIKGNIKICNDVVVQKLDYIQPIPVVIKTKKDIPGRFKWF